MPSRRAKAVEMTGRGMRGKPKTVSPSSHRPWKSLRDSHIPTASTTRFLVLTTNNRQPNLRKEPLLGPVIPAPPFRLIFQLECAADKLVATEGLWIDVMCFDCLRSVDLLEHHRF
jgi:hypothetical protein